VIGDLVEVAKVETVVRLDGSSGRLSELVLTGDVAGSLAVVLEASGRKEGGEGAAFFVVGPFGSGKSHFLAAIGELLADPTGSARLPAWEPRLLQLLDGARPSLTVPVPLVEYRAQAPLEDVVAKRAWLSLGKPLPPLTSDRAHAWDALLAAAHAAGWAGVTLLLDELSEFLRAKQGPPLTEDLRFLQFLGEWSARRPVLVLGALQESIEEVANVSQRELARIRDRFRPSLSLSMRHVEDLVRGRLVRLRPGAALLLEQARREIAAAYPEAGASPERFSACYPLHPETLSVLEGLKFLLSQQRGVVDFICRRLVEAVGRPYGHLVTPDEVFDHFRDRLHERSETARLADTVVPYYERAACEVAEPEAGQLLLRTVKLLSLLAASPLERPRSARELAYLLLVRESDIDPAANVALLERTVLDPLVRRGAYVVVQPGLPPTYRIDVGADAALVAQARVAQLRAELSPLDRRLVDTLAELGSSPPLPLDLLAQLGTSRRDLLWQNTRRQVTVGLSRLAELGADEVARAAAQARAAGAEGSLVLDEIELDQPGEAHPRARALVATARTLVIWVPDGLRPGELDALLDICSRRRALEAARAEGREDVTEVLERAAEADAAVAREILRRAYFEGALHGPEGAAPVDLPSLAGLPFERQLPRLVDPLLSTLHPRHQEVAPRAELGGERLVRQLVTDVIVPGRLGPAALARSELRSLVQAYLVPLGLGRLRADGVTLAPDPARSPAVAEAVRLVGDGDPVRAGEVLAGLADGPVGLAEPEALLVLNACVQAGLVEAWRGRRRLTEPFFGVTEADRLAPGELVEPSVRAAVAAASPVTGSGPFEPWTSSVQRSAWAHATSFLSAQAENLAHAREGILRLEEIPALAAADTGPLRADLETVQAVVEACPATSSPAAGLRQLAAALGDDGAAVRAAASRLSGVVRFFRDDLRRLEDAAGYLTHPELHIPDENAALRSRRDAAVALLQAAVRLAAEDRAGDVFAAAREFKAAYLANYQQAHDRHYAAVPAGELERVRAAPPYRALAALSAIGAVAVPDDRIKVDRLLAAAVPPTCRRRVDVELQWKPRCSCGLALGDPLPVLDAEAVWVVARHGVRQYLTELDEPDTRARLEDAARDLSALGRTELSADLLRLLGLAADPVAADPSDVAHLVGPDLARVVGDALSGTQLLVARDLAALREDLVGRRYPKRRLLELLASWVDPQGDMPPGTFVEVTDSSEAAPGAGRRAGAEAAVASPPRSATGTFLARRFPGLWSALPAGGEEADAFWLAAWWGGRPSPPPWLPGALFADPARLEQAADAALSDLAARAEVADLDRRIGPETLLGERVAAALDLSASPLEAAMAILAGERLFRYPVQLAAEQLLARLAADWQASESLGQPLALASRHVTLTEAQLVALSQLVEAARHLAAVERRLGSVGPASLVGDLFPSHAARVPLLVSRAELASAQVPGAVAGPEAVAAFRSRASRLLSACDGELRAAADQGYPGCLPIWRVGAAVVAPLLARDGRVAVLLVDAMRADVAAAAVPLLEESLPGRAVRWQWAVVPPPTRTAEAVAALSLGRPSPSGSAAEWPGSKQLVPFAHLGYETATVLGADRDDHASELLALWSGPAPVSVAVATGLDERLHRTSVELAALVDEAVAALSRRVVPSLAALPPEVPLVVLSDHGFRENPAWGHGPEGRYVHGGDSLFESVVPVVVLEARSGEPGLA
jgi:hypothetical protein